MISYCSPILNNSSGHLTNYLHKQNKPLVLVYAVPKEYEYQLNYAKVCGLLLF